jgi:hypothetical protein
MRWKTFLKAHWGAIAATDFFTIEAITWQGLVRYFVLFGHGLFSLLDAFPFQHPDAPELSVSIPISERIFGQGAGATFDDFVVTIDDRS